MKLKALRAHYLDGTSRRRAPSTDDDRLARQLIAAGKAVAFQETAKKPRQA